MLSKNISFWTFGNKNVLCCVIIFSFKPHTQTYNFGAKYLLSTYVYKDDVTQTFREETFFIHCVILRMFLNDLEMWKKNISF